MKAVAFLVSLFTVAGATKLAPTAKVVPFPLGCPIFACAHPCGLCPGKPFSCRTKPTYFTTKDGKRCQGCPVADCEEEEEPCPVPRCINICSKCSEKETCVTKPGFFTLKSGKQCESCPVFVKCEPKKPRPPICPLKPCFDICSKCSDRKKCVTEANPLRNGCPGCPKLVSCGDKDSKCCKGPKPPSVKCGRSGCTCCSDGEWKLGNSGPNQTPTVVCKRLGLRPSKKCPRPPVQCCKGPRPSMCDRSGCRCCDGKWVVATESCRSKGLFPAKQCPRPKPKCCRGPKPPRSACGRSGCTCCSDGVWKLGNSGPTLPRREICRREGLFPSRRCPRPPSKCCNEPKPKRKECGLSGCTCCSDGKWQRGHSGPSVSRRDVCAAKGLFPSKRCTKIEPEPQKCGPKVCAPGLVCCNPLCGTCTKPGQFCTLGSCGGIISKPIPKPIPLPPSPQMCGKKACAPGLVCCNASCGTCTKPGGFCTQQACDPLI